MKISLLLELRRCYLFPGGMMLHFLLVSSVQLEVPEGILYKGSLTDVHDIIHEWEACCYGIRLLNHTVVSPLPRK